MTLATDLQVLGRHLTDALDNEKRNLLIEDSSQAYEVAVYGEPKVITSWPTLSVQPVEKLRSLREGATRKFNLTLRYFVIIYHGRVADTLSIQEGTHERAERVEAFLHTDFKWNFADPTDNTKDQVIFGYVTLLDHPVVVAPDEQLWSSSRLELTGMSQELF